MNTKGFNLTISIPSGNPDRLRLIQKTNRRLFGLVFNRDEWLSIAKERPQLCYTGVYLLVGNGSDALPTFYIGEAESVLERFKVHSTEPKRDFWEWTIAFVTIDNSMNKAYAKYLEAALFERASSNKRCQLNNDHTPKKPVLDEKDQFETDDFLNDIYQMLPLLGITAFEQIVIKSNGEQPELLIMKTKGIEAQGVLRDGHLIVKKNSQAVKDNVSSIPEREYSLRKALIDQNVLVGKDNHLVFTEDYAFSSPSRAAGVIAGSSANGRDRWRNKQGETLNQIQKKAVEKAG